jgi:DNA mismatch repair protein MutL
VSDLFFNTPARKKFLRTEKTEYLNCERVFKQMALAYFDVTFLLKHNGKIIKRLPAASSFAPSKKLTDSSTPFKTSHRLEKICGQVFSDGSIPFSCQHEIMSVNGFLGGIHCHRSESDIQFVFINGRSVRDTTLSHAIKQAYHARLPEGRMPTYVIFVVIDPKKIDVNVHPTKHEVRFEKQREVHDLLSHMIAQTLDEHSRHSQTEATLSIPKISEETPIQQSASQKIKNYSSSPSLPTYSKTLIEEEGYKIQQNPSSIHHTINQEPLKTLSLSLPLTSYVIAPIKHGFSLLIAQEKAYVVNELKTLLFFLNHAEKIKKKIPAIPLLFPKKLTIDIHLLEEFDVICFFEMMGFFFSPLDKDSISLNKVPLWTKALEKSFVFDFFIHWMIALNDDSILPHQILYTVLYQKIQGNQLLNSLVLQAIFLNDWMQLTNENIKTLSIQHSVIPLTDEHFSKNIFTMDGS